MNVPFLLRLVIQPTLSLMSEVFNRSEIKSIAAQQLLIAIAVQESGLFTRRQIPDGPALSFWQIEPLTAMDILHRWKPAKIFCENLKVPVIPSSLELNDFVACCIARGILWLTPGGLPTDEAGTWDYYLKSWRPGKPRPETWPNSYRCSIIIQ